MTVSDRLRDALRLIVITDRAMAAPRTVEEVVEASLRAGARAIQLRDKELSPVDLLHEAQRLRALTHGWDALFFVNDRFDVALASGADGVHLGPEDLPVAAVRAVAPEGFLIGHSTDDPSAALVAEAAGADYLGCGSVFPTTSKDVGTEAIGVERLDAVARCVQIPVVGIGGVTPERAKDIARTAACGTAVIGAVSGAPDPAAAVRALLLPFHGRQREP
jgi:thiamine-phosphate pyrophosphorylase